MGCSRLIINKRLWQICSVGTKEYTAPEVLRASGHSQNEYDTKADVYSLGICIWEILTKMWVLFSLCIWFFKETLWSFDEKYFQRGLLLQSYEWRAKAWLLTYRWSIHQTFRVQVRILELEYSAKCYLRCWAYSPSQRPSMEEIVMFFDKQEREISI